MSGPVADLSYMFHNLKTQMVCFLMRGFHCHVKDSLEHARQSPATANNGSCTTRSIERRLNPPAYLALYSAGRPVRTKHTNVTNSEEASPRLSGKALFPVQIWALASFITGSNISFSRCP